MSHFTVLVVGKDVEKQLEPFNEQTDDPKYLRFEDLEDEYTNEYENEGTEMIQLASGELYYPWDCRFKVGPIFDQQKVYPPDSKEIFVKYKDRYGSLEDFASKWHGRSRDEKTGRFGRWYNPNAKWDWWTVGGRWSGYFAKQGGPQAGYTDQAIKRDIDLVRMRREHVQERLSRYHQYHGIVQGRTFKSWEQVLKEQGEDKIEEARTFYWSQPAVADLRKSRDFAFGSFEDYQFDEPTFMENERLQAVCTFAVLRNGQWYERGSMGWWGIVTDEKDKLGWAKEFNEMLDSLPWNTQLTLVDAHI